MTSQTVTETFPASTTIANLNGVWTLDKHASHGVEDSMDVQGLSWFIRKAIGLSTIKIRVEHIQDEDGPDRLNIVSFGTHSRTTTTEIRVLDFSERENHLVIFGTVKGRSRYVMLAKDDRSACISSPQWPVDLGKSSSDAMENAADLDFLTAGWLGETDDGSPVRVIETQGYCIEGKWFVHQVWGFQNIEGQRRHVRKMAVWKGKRKSHATLVYSYFGAADQQ